MSSVPLARPCCRSCAHCRRRRRLSWPLRSRSAADCCVLSAIGGRVRYPFTWQGIEFAKGEWVLLDLYGTNLDNRTWSNAEKFDPDRFQKRQPTPFVLIPQGAGDADVTHRCPGEALTLEVIKAAVRELTGGMSYQVPDQDLSVSHKVIPALPASGFLLSHVAPEKPTRRVCY
jgi:fatty-acid peroxygenase